MQIKSPCETSQEHADIADPSQWNEISSRNHLNTSVTDGSANNRDPRLHHLETHFVPVWIPFFTFFFFEGCSSKRVHHIDDA